MPITNKNKPWALDEEIQLWLKIQTDLVLKTTTFIVKTKGIDYFFLIYLAFLDFAV